MTYASATKLFFFTQPHTIRGRQHKIPFSFNVIFKYLWHTENSFIKGGILDPEGILNVLQPFHFTNDKIPRRKWFAMIAEHILTD